MTRRVGTLAARENPLAATTQRYAAVFPLRASSLIRLRYSAAFRISE